MIWTQIAVGVLSSIVAAGLFLYLMSRLRPDIRISEQIAKHKSGNSTTYKIKIINQSSRDAINLKAELSVMQTKIVPDGHVRSSIPLKLKKSEIVLLSKMDSKDGDGNYAYRLTINEDLEKIWKDESSQFVRIKIFAQDEMSNFGKVFVREYRTKRNSIIDGQFKFGNSLEIA